MWVSQHQKDPPLKYSYQDGEKKEDVHRVDGGKGHYKQKNKKPKLIFNELLTKYKKETELNVTNRPRKVQSSKVSPKHKSQE
jgi:hypothetical protein